ncbi:hypothetical protein [Modestobacter sp. KNN46-3]|jgi:hypothetical protein|uniref:hypothetical protein n=1 Tax=Modestobacter sp. KNN46-3 TaxID=2711218 RepID=UPI0013DF6F2A|nr:hypothetical protein [Modestobacter sp. KNN46-3]
MARTTTPIAVLVAALAMVVTGWVLATPTAAHARQGVVSAASGASCGIELSGDGPFLVFAGGQDGGPHRAGLCGGTAPAAPQLVAEVRALSAAEGAAVAVDPLPGAAGTELRSAPQPWAGVLVAAGAGLVLLTALLVRRSRRRGA